MLRQLLPHCRRARSGKKGANAAVAAPGYRKATEALHPLGHLGEPDDIAWGAVYLASNQAKFVTGTELVIDGGYTAR